LFFSSGNRLVTVPPQALGISPGPAGVEPPAVNPVAPVPALPSNAVTPPLSAVIPPPTPPPAISSRTMEQLAEFDSILESKFQYKSTSGSNSSVLLQGSANSGPVIKCEVVEPTAGDVAVVSIPDTSAVLR